MSSTILLDLISEILEEFDEDDQIDDAILDDLSETIEILLYERRSLSIALALSGNDKNA